MRAGEDYRRTVRRGAKAARPTLVAHVVLPIAADAGPATSVGFVVNRSVGSAVQRNRVKRRLRHLMRSRLSGVPAGSRVVIRALPAASTATSAMLSGDLDEALSQAGAW